MRWAFWLGGTAVGAVGLRYGSPWLEGGALAIGQAPFLIDRMLPSPGPRRVQQGGRHGSRRAPPLRVGMSVPAGRSLWSGVGIVGHGIAEATNRPVRSSCAAPDAPDLSRPTPHPTAERARRKDIKEVWSQWVYMPRKTRIDTSVRRAADILEPTLHRLDERHAVTDRCPKGKVRAPIPSLNLP